MHDDVIELAHRMLDFDPDPVPRFRILRDILHVREDDLDYQTCRSQVIDTPFVSDLSRHQLDDGSWGRFHTQDTKVKPRPRFPTTEAAIMRAIALGLDRSSPMLKHTISFLESHINGECIWRDHAEKHDHPGLWDYSTRLMSASNLAFIDKDHPLVEVASSLVAEATVTAFSTGEYNREQEIRYHIIRSGINSRRHLPCHNRYGLLLLAALQNRLIPEIEMSLLRYVMQKPEGIFYIYSSSIADLPPVSDRRFARWLSALELLAEFEGWKQLGEGAIEWIWKQRNPDGLWDFGAKTPKEHYFPLSSNWRKETNRVIDCSVRVLSLLQKFYR